MLLDRARGGDRGALARLLSMVERGGPSARAVAAVTYRAGRGAHVIGITGASGAGKSTLTSALCRSWAESGEPVGVLAIDPSSPFSGGAILGDRVRMSEQGLDNEVFIRSMATRGHLGGLSFAAPEAARVLDSAGFDPVVIETVGVGQIEVEIAARADTTVVVVNPGWGDAVQAAKAGLMEIADIFVVNKADREGAPETVRDLESLLAMSGDRRWRPPVIRTVATDGLGTDELRAALVEHRDWLGLSGVGVIRRRQRVEEELRAVVAARLAERAEALCAGEDWDSAVEELTSGHGDPWSSADDLLRD